MNFLNKANGVHLGAAPLSPEAQKAVIEVLPECREAFRALMIPHRFNDVGEIGNTNYYLGGRFLTDRDVIDRLKGWSDEVLANTKAYVMDALRDCASADYYYRFEKEY